MSNQIPAIKTHLTQLLNDAMLMQSIDTEYLEADLVFAAPFAYEEGTVDQSEPEAHNTSVLVTAGEGQFAIEYNLHYTRLDLETLAVIRGTEIDGGVATTTNDLLAEINTLFNLTLTADDLEDLPIEDGIVTVRALPTSLAVIGETILEVAEEV